VRVSTDAPVPQFGDRLLLEVLGDDGAPACTSCRRELGVTDATTWPVSFGVVASSDAPVHVRVRLYRADHTGPSGVPEGTALLDAVGRLPVADGVPSDVVGHTSCAPASGLAVAEPTLGPLQSPPASVGSWTGAKDVPCSGSPPAGMVCVPGGAFLMGGPDYFPTDDASAAQPEHLVQLSAYALDVDEVTVGVVRDLLVRGLVTEEPTAKLMDPSTNRAACTYLGKDAADNDALPVNCVSLALSRSACAALGKRLPTEAEWEFAAGNRTAETKYPWGYDDDGCSNAIVSRGRSGIETLGNIADEFYACRVQGQTILPWGPQLGGHPKDVTTLGLKNLGGNLTEWVEDAFGAYAGPCWNKGAVLVNPTCTTPDAGPSIQSLRGGDWAGPQFNARAYQRGPAVATGPEKTIGFRCAVGM
jgi:formylglycine-generating enzyme required for sulfatase activity